MEKKSWDADAVDAVGVHEWLGEEFQLTKIMGNSVNIDLPAPQFRQFERVEITGKEPRCSQYHGEHGTILCFDSFNVAKYRDRPDQWIYVVYLPSRNYCRTFMQSSLNFVGEFDLESDHSGQRAEISFDIVLDEDMDWAEGSFRLPGEFWKVMIFHKNDEREIRFEPRKWAKRTKWEPEFTGIVFQLPRADKVDRDYLLNAMFLAFDYNDWVEVSGPDSMIMR